MAVKINLHKNREEAVEKFIDLGKIWPIVKKNWLVLERDKARLIPMMMFPLIMILIYGSTAGTTTKFISAAVVNYDGGAYSQQVVSTLYADQTFTITAQVASQDQARRMLDENKAEVFFVIPPDFGSQIEQGANPQISVFVDKADGTAAAVAQGQARALAQRVGAMIQAQRIIQATARLQQTQATLQQAQAVSNAGSNAKVSRDLLQALADTSYSATQKTSATASATLLAKAMASRNTLGYVVDPNLLIGAFEFGTSSSLSGLFRLVDTQQQTLNAIAFYNSLSGQFGQQAAAATKIYSALGAARSASQAQAASATAAQKLVSQAELQLEQARKQISNSNTFVSVNYVEAYGSGRGGLDFLLANILALVIFQGAAAGLGRAIAGERQNGSMTRVFLTPTSSTTIIVGTQLFYLVVEAVRSAIIVGIAIAFFGVVISGSIVDVMLLIALYAIGATGVGMALSVLARTQEQYMSMSMVIILPTIFLSGVFFPIQSLPSALQWIAGVLPMAPMATAMNAVIVKGLGLGTVLPEVAYLAAFGIVTVAASIMLFQREQV